MCTLFRFARVNIFFLFLLMFPAMFEKLKFMDFERRATVNQMQFTNFALT